jgi:trehalose-6-phosphate synthase
VHTEFVGCSPSLSGAIRVNPWSVESLADGLFAALRLPLEHRRARHDKHWRYVSHHTVAYWSTSYITELQVVGLCVLGGGGGNGCPNLDACYVQHTSWAVLSTT